MEKSLDKFILYLQEKLFGYLYNNKALKDLKMQESIYSDIQNGKREKSEMVSPFEVFSTICELANSHLENCIEKEEALRTLHGFLLLKDEDIPETDQVYIDFETLSVELEKSNLKRKEKVEVLMQAVKTNCNILKQYDYDKSFAVVLSENPYACQLLKLSQLLKSSDILGKLLYGNEYIDDISDKILDNEYRNNFKNNYDNFLGIYERYSKAIENMTEEDIDFVIQKLKEYGTIDELIETFKWVWNNRRKKSENLKEVNSSNNESNKTRKSITSKNISKNYINEKEYKKCIKEIKDIVRSIKDETCDLSYEEIIEFGKKLMLTGYCDEQNAILLMNQAGLKEKEAKENPVLDYISMYNKLCFYEHKEFIYDELKNIKDCLLEMMIPNDEEDYTIYKKMIEEEMVKIREKLFYKDEYERNLIRK